MNLSRPDTTINTRRWPSVRLVMLHVMLALLPGIIVYALVLDFRVLINLLLASMAAVCAEALFLAMRHKPVWPTLQDGSIILAAWLLALSVPPSLPHWHLILGVFVMTGLGKHLFGGLGHNPFNPAMVAYAVLLVSFPVTMTHWDWQGPVSAQTSTPTPTPTPAPAPESKSESATGTRAADSLPVEQNQGGPARQAVLHWDAVSGATALDTIRNSKFLQAPVEDQGLTISRDEASALVIQTPWVWLSIAWVAGGLYLLLLRIISWHIPVALLGTVAFCYTLSGLTGHAVLPAGAALLSGAILFGAFFIATDPVSAPASRAGQLVFGFGIGFLAFFIREYSVYPEGMAFAVLLMNTTVPLIDHLMTGGPPDRAGNRVGNRRS